MQDDDYHVLSALARILIRNGSISIDELADESDEMKRKGHETAGHNLLCLAIEASTMSASEFEADYRRRQMVERTAYITKIKPDGGKSER